VEPTPLPILETGAPISCSLDREALAAQLGRYREIGSAVGETRRSRLALTMRLAPSVSAELVEETLAVERTCCPFFDLSFDREGRILRIAVAEETHAPALEAIAEALGASTQSA
jgi:hypothetical protein